MALSGEVLSTLIFTAMAEADAASAERSKVVSPDGKSAITVDTETPQKQLERKDMSDAIAITIIKYLIANTEVIIPSHPPNSAQTGIAAGAGPHAHSTNLPPIPHIIGRIE